ncbi:max dimerization protein 3 isoform X1 [Oncorhynchus mykiss]|uniref:max dimerization protein 3 isoform X1 n=1 Tax=Oncorhynchus mykiss TaxID=8022 RepID=UPI001878882A|nr:max dimerization protein 3 isoform X1 [Oncorhynchus mykiss]
MDANTCNIQVLLQAAEFLERREREAEHGYASVLPFYCPGDSEKKSKQKNKKLQAAGSNRTVHNELEKHRRAQLRHHLEQLKQQVPQVSDSMRNTTLNLLRRAQTHIKKLQDQDERAEQLKGRLRWEQRELRVRLEQLQGHGGLGGLTGLGPGGQGGAGAVSERMRNDSLGSAAMSSSERSDSDREDVEVDVESIVFDCLDSDGLGTVPHTGTDHCYSSSPAWAGL